jgi:cytochrome c biogenesis protein CcdA
MRMNGKRVDGYDIGVTIVGILIVLAGVGMVIGSLGDERVLWVILIAGVCLILAGLGMLGIRGLRKRDKDRPAIDG